VNKVIISKKSIGGIIMDQGLNMQFMTIILKHLPEAKQLLDEQGIELNIETMQPLMDLLLKVMNEAYDLGKTE
jgi:competence protein ComZ